MPNSFVTHTVAAKELRSTLSLFLNLAQQPDKSDVFKGSQESLPVYSVPHWHYQCTNSAC